MKRFVGLAAAIWLALAPAVLAGSMPLMGAGPAGAGAPPFTPADLTGLLVWYEADSGVFEDDSCTDPAEDTDPVACWDDKSPNDDDLLQATSGKRPTYLSTGMNGLPAIDLNVADEECMVTAGGAVAPGTGANA